MQGSERVECPAANVDAVDSVGAGDSFDAGFLYAWLDRRSLKECLAMGNVAGALSTTRAGGTEAFRDREHRRRFLQQQEAYLRAQR